MRIRYILFGLVAQLIVFGSIYTPLFAKSAGYMKKALYAGTLYPTDAQEMNLLLDEALTTAHLEPGNADAAPVIIAPTAHFLASGPVAGYAYKAVKERPVETVIILSDSNHQLFEGIAIYAHGGFETPLGPLKVNDALAAKILQASSASADLSRPFSNEHAFEMQFIFLKKLWPECTVVPILFGDATGKSHWREFADALHAALDGRENFLIVAGGNLSEDLPYKEALASDEETIRAIEGEPAENLYRLITDGTHQFSSPKSICVAKSFAMKRGWDKFRVYKYATSGNTLGDKSRVVGYLSAGFGRQN